MPRYLEDFEPGQVIPLGSRVMTKEAILAFGREFDPQAFHADEAAAARSVFGGLIASGWHTGSVLMRLLYEGVLKDVVSFGSPGLDEVRWLHPVRPGDTLTGRFTVVAARPSRSRPDRGILRSIVELTNQQGQVVISIKGTNLVGRRPAA